LSLAIAALLVLSGCGPSVPRQLVWVEIPADATLSAVSESLAVHGVVANPGAFEEYVRQRRLEAVIRPGAYRLGTGLRPIDVVWAIRRFPPMEQVVVLERMTVAELAVELEQRLNLPVESVLVAARDSALRARVGARAATVEGYLYPTTYYVPRYATARQLLRQMVDTFETRWDPAWNARLDVLGLSRDEAVTLASIVAGEMPDDGDIDTVSSVYHNRLSRGMRLQADPTVVYALGERRRLTFQDYRVPSPYNTYLHRGLPPGPIGQPSAESMHAALYPAETDYLYMVSTNAGHFAFSQTYRGHLETIADDRGTGHGRSAHSTR